MNAVIESPFAGQQARTALAETSGVAQAQAREMAEMQTKFLMAERFPRDERRAMDGVLNTFSRKTMAEMACYAFAKGGSSVSGLFCARNRSARRLEVATGPGRCRPKRNGRGSSWSRSRTSRTP